MAETESDECIIATDSTKTPLHKKIARSVDISAQFFPRPALSVEIKSWMEARANAILDQAGPYAEKKISVEDLGYFKASQVRNVFYFSSLRILSNCF